MIIFDYFFYAIYRFLNRRLKRGKEDAKHSALCIELVYISFFILMIACFIGIVYDNAVSRYFLNNAFFLYMITGVIGYIVLRIRFYKFYDVENIEQKIIQLSNQKHQILKYFYYILLIGTPVGFYVFFRLYYFGYV